MDCRKYHGNIMIILALLLLLPFAAVAQTEIEGEVSGEWTAEDSPYIVIDSTWIPENEERRDRQKSRAREVRKCESLEV